MKNIELIKEELKFVFGDTLTNFLGCDIKKCNNALIIKKFNEYAKENLQKIKIKDLIDNYQNKAFLINTPDGFQSIGDFYEKGERQIIKITTVDDFYTKCSEDHLFETTTGWKPSKNISKKDLILTKDGFRKVKNIKLFSKENVYDFEILHENHRYWSGNGLSSHNSGKTFLALSACRLAQELGYYIIYFDSEGSIDKDFVTRLGVDTSKIRLQPVNTIEQFNYIAANLTKSLEEMKARGEETPKVMVVLDSLGNLSSEKEVADSDEGKDKRDMTKQQQIRKLFRVNGLQFAKLGIPFILCNHVYACIFGENKVLMSDNTYKNIKDIKKDEEIISMAGPKKVLDTFQFDVKNCYELIFDDNYVIKCTPTHKFAIEKNKKIEWVMAKDLNENDKILIY
jgi:intein/homing endonuclease